MTLHVETSEEDSIVWEFKDSFLTNRAGYSISRDGRTLFIANALPLHSGVYIAQVDNKKQTRKVSFKVSVAGNLYYPIQQFTLQSRTCFHYF